MKTKNETTVLVQPNEVAEIKIQVNGRNEWQLGYPNMVNYPYMVPPDRKVKITIIVEEEQV